VSWKESILTSIAHVIRIIDTLSVAVSDINPTNTSSDTNITELLLTADPTSLEHTPTSVEHTPPTNVEHTLPTGDEQPPPSDAPTSATHVVSPTVVPASHDIT